MSGMNVASTSAGISDPVREGPHSVLYSIAARVGGYGLDLNAHEALKLSFGKGILGRALAYDNCQQDIPAGKIRSLRWHPVRLLSFLQKPYYYDAKKKYVDWVAAEELKTGEYDLFHGWAGNCLQSLRVARQLRIPSVLEIPTWHRDKGKRKPREEVSISKHERQAGSIERCFPHLLVNRQESLEEYDLADLLLVPSQCSAKTFTDVGIPADKLFMLGAGVDTHRFRTRVSRLDQPNAYTANAPLRFVYTGALIRRKGVHILLEAWAKADLPHATLTLVGAIHPEIRESLEKYARPSVEAVGFTREVERYLYEADVHVFPSECEGSAKTVYEACAAGLAQITTFESGDVVQNQLNGLIVPCRNVDALAAALRRLYEQPAEIARMARAARERAEHELTWDHFRERLWQAYQLATRRCLVR